MVRLTRNWIPPNMRASIYLRASNISRNWFARAHRDFSFTGSDGREVYWGTVCVPTFSAPPMPCAGAVEAIAQALVDEDYAFDWAGAWADLDDYGIMAVLHVHDLWDRAGPGRGAYTRLDALFR